MHKAHKTVYSGNLVCNADISLSTTPAEVVSSLGADCRFVSIFNQSGQELYLCVGAAGSEQNLVLIPNNYYGASFPCLISKGSRVSLRTVSGTSSNDVSGAFYVCISLFN